MPRRIRIADPVSRGFWDPWAVEGVKKAPPSPRLEAKRICVICLSEIAEGAQTVDCPYCGALGHENCFEDWINMRGKCPLCRRPITL